MERAPILIVTGLTREAALLRGPEVVTVVGGGDRPGLARKLAALGREPIAAVVSFGLAGALHPDLSVGDLVIADTIVRNRDGTRPASPILRDFWTERLAGTPFRTVAIAGVDRPVLSVEAKAELRAATGAFAVDMESHEAAAVAARLGVPFGVLRVISDAADHALPDVAGRAMRPDGSVDGWAVLSGLVRDPGQIPALLATARDAAVAFRQLRRVRGLLGPRLGLDL